MVCTSQRSQRGERQVRVLVRECLVGEVEFIANIMSRVYG